MPLVTVDLSDQEFQDLEGKRTALGVNAVGDVVKQAIAAYQVPQGGARIAQPSGAPVPEGSGNVPPQPAEQPPQGGAPQPDQAQPQPGQGQP